MVTMQTAKTELDLPLYVILGFVRQTTKWHSMSSGGMNLEQTGHFMPEMREESID